MINIIIIMRILWIHMKKKKYIFMIRRISIHRTGSVMIFECTILNEKEYIFMIFTICKMVIGIICAITITGVPIVFYCDNHEYYVLHEYFYE